MKQARFQQPRKWLTGILLISISALSIFSTIKLNEQPEEIQIKITNLENVKDSTLVTTDRMDKPYVCP